MYKMTKEEMKKIQQKSGLSVRAFCRAIDISNGDFYRILQNKKRINERISDNIILFQCSLQKSILEKLCDFICGIFKRK